MYPDFDSYIVKGFHSYNLLKSNINFSIGCSYRLCCTIIQNFIIQTKVNIVCFLSLLLQLLLLLLCEVCWIWKLLLDDVFDQCVVYLCSLFCMWWHIKLCGQYSNVSHCGHFACSNNIYCHFTLHVIYGNGYRVSIEVSLSCREWFNKLLFIKSHLISI